MRAERQEELGADEGGRAAKALWRHAHDAVVLPVDADRAREDVLVEAGALPVEIVDDHRSQLAAGPLFVFREDAPKDRLDAERFEVIGADDVDEGRSGRVAFEEADERGVVGGEVEKRAARMADVIEILK